MAKAASNGEIVACQKVLTAVSLSEYPATHAPTSLLIHIRKITRALIVTKIFFNDIANLRTYVSPTLPHLNIHLRKMFAHSKSLWERFRVLSISGVKKMSLQKKQCLGPQMQSVLRKRGKLFIVLSSRYFKDRVNQPSFKENMKWETSRHFFARSSGWNSCLACRWNSVPKL